ncbi:MAG: zinc ribbon domain-containing protein [Gemmatimonadales bacterium]
MTQPSTSEVICAACSTPGSGRFCSNCGVFLEAAICAGCGASLSPGARFCHDCGHPANHAAGLPDSDPSPSKASVSNSLPWIVAAIALVTLLAFLAGSAFNTSRGSSLDAPQNALPQAGLGETAVRGPDISQLSPQERADRLFTRVMLLNSEGKTDSVLFFAPMAISAYQMLAPMSADQRYDLGRIAEVSGALPLAKAQADTILGQNPTHLLGLILATRIASLENRAADRQAYESRLIASYHPETAKKLPEYERHGDDIAAALADARRAGAASR